MQRIAFVADSHFDESSRFDECVRIHAWIAQDIAERDVDLVIHGGDLYERRSTPRERAAVADWLRQVAEHCPAVIVRGNHDAPGDLSILSRLRTRHPILVEEGAGVHVVAGVAVGCLAWPRKAELLARMEAEVGRQEGEQVAHQALQHVIRGLGMQMAEHDGPRVLVAHAMVRSSRVSTGQPLVGCDLEVGLEDLQLARADLTLLGHIHMPQEWDGPVVYSGSPRRTAFGETEEKGYVVADFDLDVCGCSMGWQRGRCNMADCDNRGGLDWDRVPTPATPMLLLEAEWNAECLRLDFPNYSNPDFEGAEVRLRYSVASDHREAAKEVAHHWASFAREQLGAASVKVEEVVISTTRARAPEVARAVTLAGKLRSYWQARGEEPEPGRAADLLGKAHELEEEVRHAV